MNEITLETLLEGKQYRRGQTTYPKTEDLVAPYINLLSDKVESFTIKVIEPDEGTADESTIDKTYKRVWIQGKLANSQINHNKVIGLLYGLDTLSPVMKLYSGWENQACLNLSIFNPSRINIVHLASESTNSLYENIPIYLNDIQKEEEELNEAYNYLTNLRFEGDLLNQKLGILAKNCLTSQRLTSAFNNMINFIQSPQDRNGVKNIYYNEQHSYTGWGLYSALTATPSVKSMDPTREVLEIYKMFNN